MQDETLFFGIKSYSRSIGGHYCADFSNATERNRRVLRGDYRFEERARIEGVVCNDIAVTDLALNEVYVGDRYIVGYPQLEVHHPGGVHEVCGNGIVFSTYHGRTGWYDNIPVPETDAALLRSVRPSASPDGTERDVRLICTRCGYAPDEADCVEFELLMRDGKKVSALPDYGIVRPG